MKTLRDLQLGEQVYIVHGYHKDPTYTKATFVKYTKTQIVVNVSWPSGEREQRYNIETGERIGGYSDSWNRNRDTLEIITPEREAELATKEEKQKYATAVARKLDKFRPYDQPVEVLKKVLEALP